jgi:CHAT domain-containing protein
MGLHARSPDGGHSLRAFAASERARARSLLAVLRQAGAAEPRDLDLGRRARHAALAGRFNALHHRFHALAPSRAGERRRLASELLAARLELEAGEAEMARANPGYAALVAPPDLGADAARALLDEDTVLLEYALGAERSFLWALDRRSVATFELAPGPAIEALARRYVERLQSVDWRSPAEALAAGLDLSRQVLLPAAERLAARRLVVVPDGALHFVPFAALPRPASAPPGTSPAGAADATPLAPLLAASEVVVLPSAAVLAVQRQALAGRPPAPGAVVVLADPVFGSSDPRIEGRRLAAQPERLPPAGDDPEVPFAPRLERLAGSRREAEAIAAAAGRRPILLATGFEANLDATAGDTLGRFRAVHFATHGLVPSEAPERAALVLSQVDAAGRPRDGLLDLHRIYDLDLAADLVVLSGCRTALGREVRGEGLVGLTRGFLHAGARSVIASLWAVEDRATAELMGHLYRALLQKGEPPAAALRSAQLALQRQRRWAHPYYWAGFVAHGDWR